MLTVEQGKFGREKRRPVRKPKKIIENFLIGTTSGYDVIAADKTSRNEMNQIPHQITLYNLAHLLPDQSGIIIQNCDSQF